MKEANPSSPPKDSSVPAQPANISPGMAALLRQESEVAKSGEPKQEPALHDDKAAAAQNRAVLKTSLVVADVLLVLLAACLALRKGSFGFLEISLCVIALALGAWLTCLAIMWGGRGNTRIAKARQQETSRAPQK